jgi:hypothetical protein
MFPVKAFAAGEETEDVFSTDNGYIEAIVSKKNGGFLIKTVEGNQLRKSDNNKNLLYHSGDYDTSFVSFRVGEGAAARDYIFGGKYEAEGSSEVTVTQPTAGGDIIATWSVAGITFIQTISLANEEAAEHGMVSIGLGAVNNSGVAVPIQARILYDTCLGDRDYSFYQVGGNTLEFEQVITNDSDLRAFYAVDDIADPQISAYVVSTPVKAAVGHWNNLAASLFEFAPDGSLFFTNSVNEYLTADSACALYYDMGTVAAGSTNSITSYYGVYSNKTVSLANRIALNTVAPLRLNLNEGKTAYVRQSSAGIADFEIRVDAENYKSGTSEDLTNVILAVNSTSNIRPLDDDGNLHPNYDYDTVDPLTISYPIMEQGSTITRTLYFQARPLVSASFERITIGMYAGDVTRENLLGERVIYLMLPGTDGKLPQVQFLSMSPTTIYSSGTRHLYVAITNEAFLDNHLNAGSCRFQVVSADKKTVLDVPTGNVTLNDGVADLALTKDIEMSVGSWFVQLTWTDDAVVNDIVDAAQQKQTASVLNFKVSDDPKFKNECYGVLASVKYGAGTTDNPYYYRLESFKDEEAFKAFSSQTGDAKKWVEILLVFRGEFTGDKRYPLTDENGIIGYTYYTGVSKKSVDPTTKETKVENCMTINNCVDFEGGTMSIYYEDYKSGYVKAFKSPILCEFDGDLYASDSRNSIWTGQAILTKLEQGQDYSLIQYDQDGKRKDSDSDPITLVWPNIWSYAQTIAGCAFKLAYGQFGVMSNKDGELGRTIAFSASLSLSFMKGPEDADEREDATKSYFGRMKELWTDWRPGKTSLYQYAYHGARFEKLTAINMNDEDHSGDKDKGVQASVMVQDILFGCGQGLVGLNFSVDITVKNMIDSLPKLQGKLSINTINNWSFGLAGSCKLINNMKVEAKLGFKSYNDIPIPDEMYFYIGGFKPGLNIDGAAVVWLTGGGGGFSNLYDTIFCTSGLPPLKLILTASFSIVQILDGTAKLTISLSGLDLTASELKIAGEIEVIKKIQLGFYWYPDLKLQAAIYVSMFEKCIEGQGYIILIGKEYKDWFFEMFVRAALKIPDSVPVVGGMALLAIDLGISTKKIWGAFEALGIGVGVTYYWGESGVDFGTAKNKAKPTYPNLLLEAYTGEPADFPIAYDEETGKTLYAHFGTNFEAPRPAQIIGDGDLVLMDLAGVWSNGTKTSHKFNLGAYAANTNEATAVQLTYKAASLAEAKSLAQSFTVTDAENGGNGFGIEFYERNTNDPNDEGNRTTANANVSWNEESGTATFAFTVTKNEQFNKNWYINTGSTQCDVVLYNVLPLPEMTSVSAAGAINAGSNATFNWEGTGLNELDTISFFLAETTDPENDPGYSVGTITSGAAIAAGTAQIEIPAEMPSGDYYIRAVYSKDEQLNAVKYSTGRYTVTNSNMPAAVGTPTVTLAGDLKYSVSIPATTDPNTTGYRVSVLNADGTESDVANLTYDKADTGATSFEIGGRYLAPVKQNAEDPTAAAIGTTMAGLEADKSYIISVTPYKTLDVDGNGEPDTVVYGNEWQSAAMLLPAAVTPTAEITADGKTLVPVVSNENSTAKPPVFTVNALDMAATFSEAVTGTWALDDSSTWEQSSTAAAISGSFTDASSASFSIPSITEGEHILNVTGRAADGDYFSYSYPFTVDTTAPRPILSSPLNGSPFNNDGTVTLAGVTDADASIYVSIDGAAEAKLDVTPDIDGLFTKDLPISDPDGASLHSLKLYAVDPNGNRTETMELGVQNPKLGALKDIVLMANNEVPAEGTLNTNVGATDVPLKVMGINNNNESFALDPSLVFWNTQAAEGSISVDGNGMMDYTPYTKGFVEAKVEVSSGAYRTASLALNSEIPSNVVSVSATVGGSITGGGEYNEGDDVAVEATAADGYSFDLWVASGISGLDLKKPALSFKMPGNGVSLTARFVSDNMYADFTGDDKINILDLIRLKKFLLGENVSMNNKSGDLNADGSTDGLDLIRLMKYLLGEAVELH